jgi:hypothetical protein
MGTSSGRFRRWVEFEQGSCGDDQQPHNHGKQDAPHARRRGTLRVPQRRQPMGGGGAKTADRQQRRRDTRSAALGKQRDHSLRTEEPRTKTT